MRAVQARFPINPIIFAMLLAVPVTLLGCQVIPSPAALTRVTSQTHSPAHVRQMKVVMVHLAIRDLEARHFSESRFLEEAARWKLGTRFIPSYKLFFPGRSYSDEELNVVLRERGIEAVLVLGVAGVGTTGVYIPKQSYSQSTTTGSATPTATGIGVQTSTSGYTYESGGYTAQVPWASFDLALHDLDHDAIAWIATANSSGTIHARNLNLLGSFVDEGIYKLTRDGFLEVPVLPAPEFFGDPVGVSAVTVGEIGGRVTFVDVREGKSFEISDVVYPTDPECKVMFNDVQESIVERISERKMFLLPRSDSSILATPVSVFSDSGNWLELTLVEDGLAVPRFNVHQIMRGTSTLSDLGILVRNVTSPAAWLRLDMAKERARAAKKGFWNNPACANALIGT